MKEKYGERDRKSCRVAEAGEYMRDYIQDEQGKLLGLSFDYIGEISS